MQREYGFYVYILSNTYHTVFYVGVTNNIQRRTWEHKNKQSRFTNKYNCHNLMYYEQYQYINDAIRREKQLKKWHRAWKIDLIKKGNPGMDDLAKDWFGSTW